MKKIFNCLICSLIIFSYCDEKPYAAKDYSYLLNMKGFDQSLLKTHFTLYEGYVKNTNLILSKVKELEKENSSRSYEYGAFKRRFGWEFNGMRLHELYFENLGGEGGAPKDLNLISQINSQYGSYENLKKDLVATGLMRGIGWVLLTRDETDGRLIVTWINEHDVGHLALGNILLAMDVWEHAYITQFGLKREDYIDAFFKNLNWNAVEQRYKKSLKK